MIWMIILVGLFLTVGMYACVVAGKQADQASENYFRKLKEKEKQ